MLKFFRKIRQQLLNENNMQKYLLYAIGEILLVVIGILIALQINNLNDQRKDRNITQNYLKGLKEDAQNDVARLDNFIKFGESYIQKVDSISSIGNLTKEKLDEIGINRFTYFIKNDTYQEIISNGHLKLLPNAIKITLRDLNALFKAVNKIDDQVATTLNAQHIKMADFFEVKRSDRTSQYQIIANPQVDQEQALLTYKNYINVCYDWNKTKVLFYQRLKRKHLEIIELAESN